MSDGAVLHSLKNLHTRNRLFEYNINSMKNLIYTKRIYGEYYSITDSIAEVAHGCR